MVSDFSLWGCLKAPPPSSRWHFVAVQFSHCHCCVRAQSDESGAEASRIFSRPNLGEGNMVLTGVPPRQAGTEPAENMELGNREPDRCLRARWVDFYSGSPKKEAGGEASPQAQRVCWTTCTNGSHSHCGSKPQDVGLSLSFGLLSSSALCTAEI